MYLPILTLWQLMSHCRPLKEGLLTEFDEHEDRFVADDV
jgi:hypothetical protein